MNELEKQIEERATDWVFEENGHRWSNNDDSAGDNTESFKAGCNFILEKNLPVLFGKWFTEYLFDIQYGVVERTKFKTIEEAYDYWLNNVYGK